MNSELTALTRPRISSGVSSCTSELRTTTLTVSDAPSDEQRDDGKRDVGREREDDGRDAEHGDGGEHLAPDIAAQRAAREHDRHGERADRRGRAQQAEAPGTGMQDVAGEDRQQRRGAAEQHREQIERDRAEHHRPAADEGDAGKDRGERHRLALGSGVHCMRIEMTLKLATAKNSAATQRRARRGRRHRAGRRARGR